MSVDVSVPLQGKVALITGSTSGMGLEAARLFQRNGARIALHGHGSEQELKELIKSFDSETQLYNHDLSDLSAASALVPDVIADYGTIDILINNAGIQHVADLDEFDDEAWQRLIAVNLTAAFVAIRAAFPAMRARGWGRVINTASRLAMSAEPRKAGYVSTKHGLLGLTREVALEGATLGITCNAVCPGWVLTPLVRKQVQAKAEALELGFEACAEQEFVSDLPTRRFVETEEIAAAMLFLCSDAARSLTGVALPIDGGTSVT